MEVKRREDNKFTKDFHPSRCDGCLEFKSPMWEITFIRGEGTHMGLKIMCLCEECKKELVNKLGYDIEEPVDINDYCVPEHPAITLAKKYVEQVERKDNNE